MIIDSHVHLKHGDARRTEYSAETIMRTMDAVGIDRSVVFAMSATTRRSIEMAREAIREFPRRLIPYVYALPSYERAVLKELHDAISKLGFRGIKLHVGECTLAGYVVDPVIGLAREYNVPCLIDCSGRYKAIECMARTFPETKIIVAHMGKYLCRDAGLIDRFIGIAEKHGNLYLDISGVVILSKIEEAVVRVGSGRVLFGTDGPHKAPDTIGFAHAEITKIRSLGLDPDDHDAILGGSIARLLGI